MTQTAFSAAPLVPPAEPFDHVDTWVFDLDNTLYPAHCDLFSQVDQRMGAFISEALSLPWDEARRLQKLYFLEHGTTLRGLMTVHGLPPEPFLRYVHDIDVSPVTPSPELDVVLDALGGRKLVFTNGTTPHAERVLQRLGVARHFEAIFDIVAAEYLPKPDPRAYDRLIERHAFVPAAAAMIEDMGPNLAPAHALGMTTVWVRGTHSWCAPRGNYVHHHIDDVLDWLTTVVATRRAAARE